MLYELRSRNQPAKCSPVTDPLVVHCRRFVLHVGPEIQKKKTHY